MKLIRENDGKRVAIGRNHGSDARIIGRPHFCKDCDVIGAQRSRYHEDENK